MERPSDALETLSDSLAGSRKARQRLMEIVYDDLRALAGSHLARERQGHTLQPTALVHEAYLRLIGQSRVDIESRTHFLAVAATTMRRVLIDHARGREAAKREGGRRREALDEADAEPGPAAPWEDPAQVLDLDRALEKLASTHPRSARVVELKFFAGLSHAEVAASLGLSRETVKLDWRFARAWLNTELAERNAG